MTTPTPPLKVIILDVSDTVLDRHGNAVAGIRDAISQFRRAGVKIAMVGNGRDAAMTDALLRAGLTFDMVIGRDTAGRKKPAPIFCELPGSSFGAAPHQMLYVGDNDMTDALCAINAHVLYLAAKWANSEPKYGLPVDDPGALLRFVFRFLMSPPRWYWVTNRKDALRRHVHVRALLPMKRSNYNLKKVLKEGQDVRVNGVDLWGFLSRRLLTALVADGLLTDVDTWTWYPGHKGAPTKPRYAAAFDLASRIFRDRHIPDLLVRHKVAIKLAYARSRGDRPPFSSQVQTVHLNSLHSKRVVGKHVLVADDFSTEGLSFEWARNLLLTAGARDVTCVSIGRYWEEYKIYTPKPSTVIKPWEPSTLGDDDFLEVTITGKIDQEAEPEMERLIRLQPPGTTRQQPSPQVSHPTRTR